MMLLYGEFNCRNQSIEFVKTGYSYENIGKEGRSAGTNKFNRDVGGRKKITKSG